jgi:hypothetical protein
MHQLLEFLTLVIRAGKSDEHVRVQESYRVTETPENDRGQNDLVEKGYR